MITDLHVTAAKIAANAVIEAKIASGAVTFAVLHFETNDRTLLERENCYGCRKSGKHQHRVEFIDFRS